MSQQPYSGPVPRVARDRRDDRYRAGHPSPSKRPTSGWVVSVQDNDSCTVMLFEEEVSGVVYLGPVPEVGDIVEVESRGDLLVALNVEPGVAEPPWFELALPTVYIGGPHVTTNTLTIDDQKDFTFTGLEYRAFNDMKAAFGVNSPVGWTGAPVYEIDACWDISWRKTNLGVNGGQYWNVPWSDGVYNGATEERPDSTLWHGYATPGVGSGGMLLGWYATNYSSGGATSTTAAAYCKSVWLDLTQVMTRFGTPPYYGIDIDIPEPPPGYVIEWEEGEVVVLKVEVTFTEPVSTTDTSVIAYLGKYEPGSGWGPNPANPAEWAVEHAYANPRMIGPWTGGIAWTDVTSFIEPTGKTWMTVVPDVVATGARYANSTVANTTIEEMRDDVQVAFRFTITPSRYRFVPE